MKAEELLQEPIENALYSTGKFTTDECEQLAEGIIQYIIDAKALEQYAAEVSRERAIDFYISHLTYSLDRMHIAKEYDDWLKEQEEQP